MRKLFTLLAFGVVLSALGNAPFMKKGAPAIRSMGTLVFNEDGVLFIGDSKNATIYAVDLQESPVAEVEKPLMIPNLETKLAALLGTTDDDVLIHDIAVNPVSKNTYISVSRGRANWTSNWQLPKELSDATILVRVSPDGTMEEASLSDVLFAEATIPNPVSEDKDHRWKKGAKLRADAISDIAFSNGKVYISGLSNEEFAASMWVLDYPFTGEASATTLEIFHGAHGKYETHSPVRAFLPYEIEEKEQILAAYLCTPLVTFETASLKDGTHVKGRTVAEFGSGNFPVDMVLYQNNGNDYILMSHSQLPLMIIDPKDVADYKGSITEEVEGYLAGVKYTPRSGSGIYQLADFNEKYILATQRLAGGNLALVSLSKSRLRP